MINRVTFFKRIGIGLTALIGIKIIPKEKLLNEIEYRKLEYTFSSVLTDQVLIPYTESDGSVVYDTNVFGQYCRFVGKAYTKTSPLKVLKFESPLELRNTVNFEKQYRLFNKNCIAFIEKDCFKSGLEVSQYPRSITISHLI